MSMTVEAWQTRAPSQAERELREALLNTKNALTDANECGIITDTIWFSDHETLFDYIDALLAKKQ
jgi:hypothetical protein